ncbi:MAG TPA: META domain-containing protein [Candidatus Krumholzibacteria bacterium]|nr:META domain-containing protein [Candidatus Krumholzibacteria bacterium]
MDSIGRGPWRWIATQTPVKRITCVDPDMYALTFLPDGTARIIMDCNRGSGSYHLDGKSIRIGPVATTRMMCPPGSMDTIFGQEIDAARTWFMQGDTLMLDLMADSGTMRFVR